MGINAKEAGSNTPKHPPLEPGTYPARLIQVLDLGLQLQRPFQGQEKPPAHEIMLTYECADAFLLNEDGEEMKDKPRWISESMPLFSLGAERAKSTARYNTLEPTGVKRGDFGA